MDKAQLENNVKAQLRQKLEEFEKGYILHASEIKGSEGDTIAQLKAEYWRIVDSFVADRSKAWKIQL